MNYKLSISRSKTILVATVAVILGASAGGRLLASSISVQAGAQAASKPAQSSETSVPLQDVEGDAAKGKETFQESCSICHETSSKAKLGPGLQGISKKDPHKLTDGTEVADESSATLRKQIVKGAGTMPPVGAAFSDKQVDDLIAYLRTL
jgi:mono/diheme cytochrome c family protein